MENLSNNSKINMFLDELSNEYKTLLFRALVSRSKSFDDLSVSDLIRLDSEIKKPLFESYQKQKRRTQRLLVLGLTYMLLGIMIYFASRIPYITIHDFKDMIGIMSGIVVFVGFAAVAYSLILMAFGVYPSRREEKSEEKTKVLEFEVIIKWRELEGLVNDISLDNSVNNNPSIIGFLHDNGLITQDEQDTLRKYLKLRNAIVHSNDYE